MWINPRDKVNKLFLALKTVYTRNQKIKILQENTNFSFLFSELFDMTSISAVSSKNV